MASGKTNLMRNIRQPAPEVLVPAKGLNREQRRAMKKQKKFSYQLMQAEMAARYRAYRRAKKEADSGQDD